MVSCLAWFWVPLFFFEIRNHGVAGGAGDPAGFWLFTEYSMLLELLFRKTN